MLNCVNKNGYDVFRDPKGMRKLVDKTADILEPPEKERELLEPKHVEHSRKHRNAYPFIAPVNKKGRTHYPSDRAMLLCTVNPVKFYQHGRPAYNKYLDALIRHNYDTILSKY